MKFECDMMDEAVTISRHLLCSGFCKGERTDCSWSQGRLLSTQATTLGATTLGATRRRTVAARKKTDFDVCL